MALAALGLGLGNFWVYFLSDGLVQRRNQVGEDMNEQTKAKCSEGPKRKMTKNIIKLSLKLKTRGMWEHFPEEDSTKKACKIGSEILKSGPARLEHNSWYKSA